MNVLIFGWRDPKHPLAGGAEQVMHEHAKGWVKAGHKVTLFSAHFKGAPRKESLDGVRILRWGFQYWGVHFAGALHYLKNRGKYDFVVDQFHGIPFFTPLYVRKPKLAVLQEVAREVWLMNHLPKPFNWIVGLIGYIGEPFVFFFFYRNVPFMVGSRSAKEDLRRFGVPADKITVVPHGVLVHEGHRTQGSRSIRRIGEQRKTVIYLGALSKDKGIEDAIRAFAALSKKGDFNFWVVGKGNTQYTKHLKEMVRRLGLANKVEFFGFVDEEKKFELLARAHVLVNPSVREGWGLVNIEANAVGTPVVAYRSPGLVDSVKDGESGILVKKNTPAEMAREAFNLLNNEDNYEKLKDGAIKWSKNFSWQKSRKKSLRLIKEAADED